MSPMKWTRYLSAKSRSCLYAPRDQQLPLQGNNERPNSPIRPNNIPRRINKPNIHIPTLVRPSVLAEQTVVAGPVVDAIDIMQRTGVGVPDAVSPGSDGREVAFGRGREDGAE